MKVIPGRYFLAVAGECNAEEFKRKASQLKTSSGTRRDLQRFFVEQDELFVVNGRTYAVSNQWSIRRLRYLDELLAQHPKSGIRYEKVVEQSG